MSKRSPDDCETPGSNKKAKTLNVDNMSGNNNFGNIINSKVIYNELPREQKPSITDTCKEFQIYEEIRKNGNENNFFYNSIITHNLSADQINKIFRFLIDKSRTKFLNQVISSTLSKWNILDIIEDSTQIKKLLRFFTKQLKSFSKVLFEEQNQDDDNLLHILSKIEDLTVLRQFMFDLGDHIKTEPSIKFLRSKCRDGSNFFHLICSKKIENPEIFLEIIENIQTKLGKPLIAELVTGKTKQGEDLFNVMSKNQESETISLIWNWFVRGYQDIAEKIAQTRDNDGQNIPQTMFHYNSRAQEAIPGVIRLIHVSIAEYQVLEDLVTGKNKKNDNLCHMVFEGNRRLFVDILQMKELDKNLIEKIFFLPGSNKKRVMDKLCRNFTYFKKAISTVHNKHGLDMTRSILYNGNEDEFTVFIKILKYNEIPTALQFLDWVLEEYRADFTFDWLRRGKMLSYIVRDETEHEKFIQWVFDNLHKRSVENITKAGTKQNSIILKCYTEINHEALPCGFLKSLIDQLDHNVVLEVLKYKNYDDFNFMDRICFDEFEIPIIEVLKLLFKNLEQNVVAELLLSKGRYGYTFLHLLCLHRRKTDFKELLELLFNKLEQNVVAELLFSKGRYDRTFLEILFFIKSKEKEQILNLLQLKLDPSCFKKLKCSSMPSSLTRDAENRPN